MISSTKDSLIILILKIKKIEGNLSYFDARKNTIQPIYFTMKFFKFYSNEKVGDKTFYSGIINFYPFFSKLEVNLKSINIKDLLDK